MRDIAPEKQHPEKMSKLLNWLERILRCRLACLVQRIRVVS